jgi:hypothetical protein
VDQLVADYDVKATTTPAFKAFLSDTDPTLTDAGKYASLVMRLMYAALRTRPDILFSVTYRASKAKDPNAGDLNKALHIIGYLRATRDFGITIRPTNTTLFASVDASFCAHEDSKSHTGAAIDIGGSMISFRSRSKSSGANRPPKPNLTHYSTP